MTVIPLSLFELVYLFLTAVIAYYAWKNSNTVE